MQINKYIGIPFKDGGRDFSGVDCWGLAYLIYKNEYGIELPTFKNTYAVVDTERITDLIARYKEGWELTTDPKHGSLVLFKVMGHENHVGIVLNKQEFIHSRLGYDVAIARFDNSRWASRVAGYYNYTTATETKLQVLPPVLQTKVLDINPQQFKTIEETVLALFPQQKDQLVILVNNQIVPKEYWNIFPLIDGDKHEYRIVAGREEARLIAFIAVAIAAPYVANFLAGGALTTSAMAIGAGSAFTSVATAAFATAAVSLAGSFLINAIAPIRPPVGDTGKDPGSAERQLMISGSANRATPYEAIPVILGTTRITPPLAAQNYITYPEERVSYLNTSVAWGFGPLSINNIKIGEIPISNYSPSKTATLTGYNDVQSEFNNWNDIYYNDIEQNPEQITLECDGNPEQAVSPGPWFTSSSSQAVSKVAIAFHMPEGMRKIKIKGDGAGDSFETSVDIELQWSTNGTSWNTWKTLNIPGNKKDAYTIVEEYSPPIAQESIIYVHARRITGDDTEANPDYRYSHTVVLLNITYTSYSRKTLINPKNCFIARSAYKIKAEGQLSNQLEGINAIVSSRCRPISATPGSDYYLISSNPAVLFFHILTHPANPQRILDSEISSKIDILKLQEWEAYCNINRSITYAPPTGSSQTLPFKFEYNTVIGAQRSLLDVLKDIAAAGRASPAFIDGKWTVTMDVAKANIVQHFTPHNSWGFEGVRALPKEPDALKVTIIDRDANYQETELIVYNIDKNITNSELFEAISLPGVTSKAQAIDHAKWHFAQAKLRREIYSLNADLEYLVCNRGDRVKVTHDVPAWGLASGRIKNTYSYNNQVSVIELTESVPIGTGNYTIRWRAKTGTSYTANIKKAWNFTSYKRENNIVTLTLPTSSVGGTIPFDESNPITINAFGNPGGINAVGVFPTINRSSMTISYNSAGANIATTAFVGEVQLNPSNYRYLSLVTPSTNIESDNLFMFGEVNTETQDLLITSIEPQGAKTAKITLMDYGVTLTYNIFTDYQGLTSNTVFETQITLPPENLINGFININQTPVQTAVYSDDRAADMISPGIYKYNIKISFATFRDVPPNTKYVACEYILASENTDLNNAKIIYSEFLSGSLTITDIIVGQTYKYRLRYITSDNRAGPWSEYYTHQVVGRENNYGEVDSVAVKRIGRSLHITPQIAPVPVDFSHFEIRIFKDSGSGDFWNSTDASIKKITTTSVAIVDLKEFPTPRLSAAGIKYRIACRAVDTVGNYSSISALNNILIKTIAI